MSSVLGPAMASVQSLLMTGSTIGTILSGVCGGVTASKIVDIKK